MADKNTSPLLKLSVFAAFNLVTMQFREEPTRITQKIPPSKFLTSPAESDFQFGISLFTKPHLREREFVNMRRPQDYNTVFVSVMSDLRTSISVGDITLDLIGTQARSLAVQILNL